MLRQVFSKTPNARATSYTSWHAPAFFLTAILLLGCASPEIKGCRSDRDCPSTAYCSDGYCFRPSVGVAKASVEVLAPMKGAYVAYAMPVKLRLSPDRGVSVDILIDNQHFAKMEWPFEDVWDPWRLDSGPHIFKARVTLADGVIESDEVPFVVDRVGVRVSHLSPANGEQLALFNEPFVAEFSRPIRADNIAITLFVNDEPQPSITTVDEDQRTVRIQSASPVSPPANVRIQFKHVEGLTGATLEPEFTPRWSFFIPAWIKQRLERYDFNPGHSVLYPSMALGPDGQPLLAYVRKEGMVESVVVYQFKEFPWLPAGESTPFSSNKTVGPPSVASRNTDGLVALTFSVGPSRDQTLKVALTPSGPNSSWQFIPEPKEFEYDVMNHAQPSVAFDNAGHLHHAALRSHFDAPPGLMAAARIGDGWVFPAIQALGDEEPRAARALSLQGTGSSPLILGLISFNDGDIWETLTGIVRKLSNGTWQRLEGNDSGILDGTPGAQAIDIAATSDAAANPVVALIEGSTASNELHIFKWDGVRWIRLPAANTFPGGSTSGVSLAVNSSNQIHILYSSFMETETYLFCRRLVGNEWQLLGTPLKGAIGTAPSHPTLRISANDDIYVSWQETSPLGRSQGFVARLNQ